MQPILCAALLVILTATPHQNEGQPPAAHINLPAKFTIDRSHSYIGFAVPFMGLTKVRGSFGRFFGTLLLDADHPEQSSLTVVIRTNSIITNQETRDRHLKSPDFFDTDRYPFIIFQSRAVSHATEGFLVRGSLTMHGVTREIVLPVSAMHGESKDIWGNRRIGFTVRATVNRDDYGVAGTAFWNSEFDPGRMAIGKTVDIELDIEAMQENIQSWKTPVADSIVAEARRRGPNVVASDLRGKVGGLRDSSQTGWQVILVAGFKLAAQGLDPAATRMFELALEAAPTSTYALTTLAEARLRGGELGEATVLFERAVSLDSTYSDAVEWRRWLWLREKK